jgi:hypothetical protein
LPTLLEIAAGAVVLGVLVPCAVFRIGAQPRAFDGPRYVRTWNDIAGSFDRQNPLLRELQKNTHDNPPGRVTSARRLELLDQIIAEHERQLKDFKALRAAER